MEDDLVYDEEQNKTLGWNKVTPDELLSYTKGGDSKQLIANGETINGVIYNVYEDIKQGYTIAITEGFYNNGQGIGVGKVANHKNSWK